MVSDTLGQLAFVFDGVEAAVRNGHQTSGDKVQLSQSSDFTRLPVPSGPVLVPW